MKVKMKVFELTGRALDWAVAKCEGINQRGPDNPVDRPMSYTYRPSTDWAQGGPIIDREGIATDFDGDDWCASTNTKPLANYASTPLIAAMRCHVASKLGDVVDVPEELT